MVDRPLVVIQGATASGKTALGIHLARQLDGEIVSADSRQVYRGMDIGTAKPTAAERALVTHHVIDVVEPDGDFALADFLDLARSAIESIRIRGRLPFLVGGTGQYITALLEGWTIPRVPPDPALRQQLGQEAVERGTPELYARLRALDPDAAVAIHPNNLRRIIRALEVCIVTGERFSQLRHKEAPGFRVIHLGLAGDREQLYARADRRLDQMIADGLVDEVNGLLTLGYRRSLPSMSGLGYAEIAGHLLDGEPLPDAIQRAKFNTHNFIRRQLTWFRGHDSTVTWYDVSLGGYEAIQADVSARLADTYGAE